MHRETATHQPNLSDEPVSRGAVLLELRPGACCRAAPGAGLPASGLRSTRCRCPASTAGSGRRSTTRPSTAGHRDLRSDAGQGRWAWPRGGISAGPSSTWAWTSRRPPSWWSSPRSTVRRSRSVTGARNVRSERTILVERLARSAREGEAAPHGRPGEVSVIASAVLLALTLNRPVASGLIVRRPALRQAL